MKVYRPPKMYDIRKKALRYLMVHKRKQSKEMKGRGCANRHPQGVYITKEESNSLTVSLYAFIRSCVMDTIDKRKVITGGIPGVFLQGD